MGDLKKRMQCIALSGIVFIDLLSGEEVVYSMSVRVVSAYPTDPA